MYIGAQRRLLQSKIDLGKERISKLAASAHAVKEQEGYGIIFSYEGILVDEVEIEILPGNYD